MILSSVKLNTLSEISRDIGQVVFASVFVEPFISGSITLPTVIIGLIFSMAAWTASLLLTKETL